MRANEKRIVGFALKSRLPSMYVSREAVDAGGLMSYGADLADSYRRVAYFVDRILKGAKPADLPVEQPTKFELVINLKTAKQIGLTIPPKVLCAGGQGDQVTTVSSQRLAVTSKTGANPMIRRIVFCLPLTLLLLTVCRGAAADENPPDRIPRWCLPFR